MTTSAAERIKLELEDGTWTNFQAIYSKNPKIIHLFHEQKARHINEGITVRDIPFEPVYVFTGAMILGDRDVEMEIYARNDADRDALWEDVRAIFKASSYDITMHDVDTPNKRNRYKVEMVATILI